MKELFYFAFADLMVLVVYDEKSNSLRYASHRKITAGERKIVEQYLLVKIAIKTDYYERPASQFIYLGQEAKLARAFHRFHHKTTPQHLIEGEGEVSAVVEGLINQSLQNYYFEQIGDAILTMRQELRNGAPQDRVAPLRRRMEELVKAYNHYSGQKISVAEVIPSELQPYLGFWAQPRSYGQSLVKGRID